MLSHVIYSFLSGIGDRANQVGEKMKKKTNNSTQCADIACLPATHVCVYIWADGAKCTRQINVYLALAHY